MSDFGNVPRPCRYNVKVHLNISSTEKDMFYRDDVRTIVSTIKDGFAESYDVSKDNVTVTDLNLHPNRDSDNFRVKFGSIQTKDSQNKIESSVELNLSAELGYRAEGISANIVDVHPV